MSYNISKELFEAVMNIEPKGNTFKVESKGVYYAKNYYTYNDFFFLCKEWAYKKGYYLSSGYNTNVPTTAPLEEGDFIYECSIYRDDSWTYEFCIQHSNNDSEQQACFDACQWILDNKDKQCLK